MKLRVTELEADVKTLERQMKKLEHYPLLTEVIELFKLPEQDVHVVNVLCRDAAFLSDINLSDVDVVGKWCHPYFRQ